MARFTLEPKGRIHRDGWPFIRITADSPPDFPRPEQWLVDAAVTDIVRALNSREALLAALKSAEAFMAGFETDPGQELDEQLATIRAAIAQAEAA